MDKERKRGKRKRFKYIPRDKYKRSCDGGNKLRNKSPEIN